MKNYIIKVMPVIISSVLIGQISTDTDVKFEGEGEGIIVEFHNTITGSSDKDGLEVSVIKNESSIINQENHDLNFGTNNSTDLTIEDGGQVGIGTTNPEALLDVEGDVKLGVSGSRFLEIREITGVTESSGNWSIYTDKLPIGWTGDKTRVLSLEIQAGYSTPSWTSMGAKVNYAETEPGEGIQSMLHPSDRSFRIYHPDIVFYHGVAWRAIIMRMP